MKRFICIVLFILSLIPICYAIDRFPTVSFENCSVHSTPKDIYKCEQSNFDVAKQTLNAFYINIHNFLPDQYKSLLEESQSYWEKFSTSDCIINTYRMREASEQYKVAEKRCLNYKIKARIQHLIYIVMIWEKETGSFKVLKDDYL